MGLKSEKGRGTREGRGGDKERDREREIETERKRRPVRVVVVKRRNKREAPLWHFSAIWLCNKFALLEYV